ncbi:VirK/YbjX family protein [Pasteurellaceae bacterium LIM206]|nr:VirK/YbjX family protein [Pasteurellaceae bacterium LIM206]
MTMTYHWPRAEIIYPDREHKTRRLKRFRFNLRSALHYNKIKQFSRFVNQQEALADWLDHHPLCSYPLVHRFLDKRFNSRQRFTYLKDNLLFFQQRMNKLQLPQIWRQALFLGDVVEGFALYLDMNGCQPMEGLWALELREQSDQTLVYQCTFGKIENTLLIGSIQGPNFEGAKEMVKLLTKRCHGLRPMHLMIEAMKYLTLALGLEQLNGIPQAYQNKSRIVQAKRYTVDYDTIFRESGAELRHYWRISLDSKPRDLAEIPSNKRSMYRKRYVMLERLNELINSKLSVKNKE